MLILMPNIATIVDFGGKHHLGFTVDANYLQYYFSYIRRSEIKQIVSLKAAAWSQLADRPLNCSGNHPSWRGYTGSVYISA
ncbi:hypothetical protein DSM106972_023730 [Dulcicalothrix desertica PCC 7102]|uniref:Uncharacterized protein n=2 Tax=Dulcicalothrix desertica TaxID=32056 RepID=A0A3S1CGZ0_9CYAN|nr:hypothetical protein [Dulcicalothrix desertica]RUT07112.1 hypothetical protein DSM106972_023730 [Dulcicalothrix desertica PCC 7102]TWH61891.1 hypothetical protein CAL7102_00570 [Dulcicalothrix desertica PCC 7102]